MEINAQLIKKLRTEKSWTQQHLADACGLSLRTIQRVERYGNASNETTISLSAVFEVDAKSIMVSEQEPQEIEVPIEKLNPKVEKIILVVSSMIIGYVIALVSK
jgi:transcriptional regulator with XRE-family HTH domain